MIVLAIKKSNDVMTSVYLHCFAMSIVYTRSMFISLRLSSEMISGYFFAEIVYFYTTKEIDHFCTKNTKSVAR